MIRFHCDSPRLGHEGDLAALALTLADMTGYVEAENRDAIHVLGAMDFNQTAFLFGIEAAALARAANRLVRVLDQGRGREFIRLPTGPGDPGMDEPGLRHLVRGLADLAGRAERAGRRVSALLFDAEPAGRSDGPIRHTHGSDSCPD